MRMLTWSCKIGSNHLDWGVPSICLWGLLNCWKYRPAHVCQILDYIQQQLKVGGGAMVLSAWHWFITHIREHMRMLRTHLGEKKQTETYLRNRQPQRKKNRFLITAQFARIAPSAFATRNTHTRADIHTSVHTYIHKYKHI